MDNSRKGALAAAASLDGSRLKLLVIGENGYLHDANCQLGKPLSHDSHQPNYLSLGNDCNLLDAVWTDGGVIDHAHPQSTIAVTTIERLNVICVFYQLSDGSIVMRRCYIGAEWKWESGEYYISGFTRTSKFLDIFRGQINHSSRLQNSSHYWNPPGRAAEHLAGWQCL